MIESAIAWISGLPPFAVYAVIALLASIENIFPPFPADTGIALGAFLAHRGVTDPWLLLGVVLLANIGTAMAIYFFAAHHAPTFLGSRIVRRILPSDGVAVVRKEYERFGLPGLFVARLLPGFRAVVPPFTGLIRLGPIRTGFIMLLAGTIWYGGIILIASQVGSHLDSVLHLVQGINHTLGIVALVALAALGVWILRRRASRR